MPKEMFRKVAMDCVSDMARHLPSGCELLVIACRPGSVDFDLVLPSPEANLNNALDALRRQGLSIDGDNSYKADLLDTVVGAMCFGKQNKNPPPAGHWGQRFWDIGRAEGELQEELVAALRDARDTVASALRGGARDWFDTDEKIAQHVSIRKIDAAIAKATA